MNPTATESAPDPSRQPAGGTATVTPTSTGPGLAMRASALLQRLNGALSRIPHDAVALLARFALAGVFWRSGQTKVQGFELDLVEGRFLPGWPRLSDSAVDLFRDEYRLPLLPPELAAVLAATAEHVLPLLLLLGLATRLSALGLLAMTAVIQLLVYPGAWPMHGLWAAALLWLAMRGPGRVSVDAWLQRRLGGC
jgi:putative oxidoreductase